MFRTPLRRYLIHLRRTARVTPNEAELGTFCETRYIRFWIRNSGKFFYFSFCEETPTGGQSFMNNEQKSFQHKDWLDNIYVKGREKKNILHFDQDLVLNYEALCKKQVRHN